MDTKNKREYIREIYNKLSNPDNQEFIDKFLKGFGKKMKIFSFMNDIYHERNISTTEIHLDLVLNPGKLYYYNDDVIDIYYKTVKLVELNSKIKILEPILGISRVIYVLIHNTIGRTFYYMYYILDTLGLL